METDLGVFMMRDDAVRLMASKIDKADAEQLGWWIRKCKELGYTNRMASEMFNVHEDIYCVYKNKAMVNSVFMVELDDCLLIHRLNVSGPVRRKVIPPDIRDPVEAYDRGYGRLAIYKTWGISTEKLIKLLKESGRSYRSHRASMASINRYCNKQWLQETYVDKLMSLRKCGKIAGVSQVSISRWLRNFGIPIRSLQDANYARGLASKALQRPKSVRISN
jgi:transposase-like protein